MPAVLRSSKQVVKPEDLAALDFDYLAEEQPKQQKSFPKEFTPAEMSASSASPATIKKSNIGQHSMVKALVGNLPARAEKKKVRPSAKDAKIEWLLIISLKARKGGDHPHNILTGSKKLMGGAHRKHSAAQEVLDLFALNQVAFRGGGDESAAWQTVRRADCAQVVVKDDVIVSFCAVDDELTLAVRSALAADVHAPALLKGAVQDTRDLLLLRMGLPQNWVNYPTKIHRTVESILFDPLVPFFHPLAQQDILADRIFAIVSRLYADIVFLGPNLAPRFSTARIMVEEALDLLDHSSEQFNDTLDESDLCLSVGVAAFVRGSVVHSSLSASDLHDVHRLIQAEGDLFTSPNHVKRYNSGEADRYEDGVLCPTLRRTVRIYASVDRETGARLPTFTALQRGSDCMLEPRVLAVVASQSVVLARVLVTQHHSTDYSGHLDPYGILAMERALYSLLDAGAFEPFFQSIAEDLNTLVDDLTSLAVDSVNQENEPSDNVGDGEHQEEGEEGEDGDASEEEVIEFQASDVHHIMNVSTQKSFVPSTPESKEKLKQASRRRSSSFSSLFSRRSLNRVRAKSLDENNTVWRRLASSFGSTRAASRQPRTQSFDASEVDGFHSRLSSFSRDDESIVVVTRNKLINDAKQVRDLDDDGGDIDPADLHTEHNIENLKFVLRSPLVRKMTQDYLGAAQDLEYLGESVNQLAMSEHQGLRGGPGLSLEVQLRSPPRVGLSHSPDWLDNYMQEVTEKPFHEIAAQYGVYV
mmetsp:Transcript_22661/g.44460  ORF Transcript_22661/g.44460 Transcript_22661/m.44460 type:complete len:756 (+) Transcript_22661:349-2616(+)